MAAQAARQNLRMQKELKLLLADPPPGASFPSLSDDSSASLTSIDANFKGPEGTVYDKGVFNIKIQIPERYPFQPPIVTFATPIYHPNIDTGGRICLDILNLPPKGSWQPSLNISTVLTSIGLLLSEPNPDDGLMHDASREYKYNRQAFDQKARSMTDKYARAGETGSSFGSQDSQAHMCPSTSNIEAKGSDVSKCETEKSICQKRFGSKMKLSLQSLGSSSKQDSSKEMCEVPDYSYSGQLSKTNTIATEIDRNHDKQQVTKHKLSLKVPEVSHSGNGESTRTDMPNQCSSTLATRDTCVDSPDMLPLVKIGVNHVDVPDHDKQVPKHKLSLKVPVISCNGNGESTRPSMPNQCSSNLATRDASMDSPNLLPVVKIGVNHEEVSDQDQDQDQDCTVKCGRTDNQEMQLLEFVKMNQRTRHLDEKLQNAVSARSQEKLPCSSSTSHSEINPQQNASYGNVSGSNVIKRRKLGMISPRTSVEPRRHSDNDKENLAPNRPSLLKLPHLINSKIEPAPGNGIRCNGRMGMQALSVGQKLTGKDVKQPLESVDGITISRSNLKLHLEKPPSIPPKILNTIHDPQLDEKQQVHQVNVVESMGEFKQHSIGSPVPEATIVLDSEDSEDENVPVRSKLSLARKRLSLKRRHV